MACSTTPARESIVAATRSTVSRARSGLPTLTFGISQLPSPRKRATAGGADWQRGALVRHQLTPGLTSLLPAMAGLPPFISFSTSYLELNSAVLRPCALERNAATEGHTRHTAAGCNWLLVRATTTASIRCPFSERCRYR